MPRPAPIGPTATIGSLATLASLRALKHSPRRGHVGSTQRGPAKGGEIRRTSAGRVATRPEQMVEELSGSRQAGAPARFPADPRPKPLDQSQLPRSIGRTGGLEDMAWAIFAIQCYDRPNRKRSAIEFREHRDAERSNGAPALPGVLPSSSHLRL